MGPGSIGLFLIHVYMGVFAERGVIDSMFYGDGSEDFAKNYHPGWYNEIASSSSPRK